MKTANEMTVLRNGQLAVKTGVRAGGSTVKPVATGSGGGGKPPTN